MVFSSQVFFFYFLPVALAAYYLSPGRYRHLVLTLFSYFFYGWANPFFTLIMFATTLVNYYCGLVISTSSLKAGFSPLQPVIHGGDRNRIQRTALIASVVVSLGALAFFKYFNFGIDTYNSLLASVGASAYQWNDFLRITLPLGISFYTFQAMSYTIDVYRGDARAVRNFIDFACYVSMFPQLVAGPIVRFQDLASQLVARTHSTEKFSRGVAFVSLGLAKKVLLANTCGKIADVCFNAGAISAPDAWIGAFAYSFQIYFDFSAYSDMAIGLGLMFGFLFPKNFDSPYLSASITEFWRRWHISLSTWLRDYLYFPLGGNRKKPSRTYVNLALVMLLGGLWHGAAWNFVIWGGIHGAFLIFERLQGKTSIYHALPAPLKTAITFVIVTIAWVFFRAVDAGAAFQYLSSMAGLGHADASRALISGTVYSPLSILVLLCAALITWRAPQSWDFARSIGPGKAVLCMSLLCCSLIVLSTQSFNPFIYFIF